MHYTMMPEHGYLNIHIETCVICGYYVTTCGCLNIAYNFICYYYNNIIAGTGVSHWRKPRHAQLKAIACYQPLRQLTLQVLQSCAMYVKLNMNSAMSLAYCII